MKIPTFAWFFALFFTLAPLLLLSSENIPSDSAKALERKFMSESATKSDAQKVVRQLFSSNEQEFVDGLYLCPFVAPRFPEAREEIELRLLKILKSKEGNRFFQALESAYAISFSAKNADELSFAEGDNEVNFIKAIIKEKAGAKCEPKPEFYISEMERTLNNGGKHLVDEKSLKETIASLNLFREIIELALSMKYHGVAKGFSRIVIQHPSDFEPLSISYSKEILRMLE